jgi:putative oxidoreductase
MPSDDRSTALAAFPLRVALGTMLLAHSLWLKLVVFTLPGTAAFFETIGLPGPLAYLVFAVEAVAGTLLLLGVEVRRAALAVVPVLVGATWAHAGNGWMFASPDGGWEYPAYLVVLAVVQALLGAGAFALRPSRPLISAAPAR